MKHKLLYLPVILLSLVACNRESYDFSYSPANPRAGETVTFTNLSTDGDEWAWEFGDIATSSLKSPTHIYKRPGTYTVVLTVDGKKKHRQSKEIVVYDTIPSISFSEDSITIFKTMSLSAIVYNPYNYSLQYEWHMPEEAVITEGDTASENMSVFFTEPGNVNIGLTVTLGSEIFLIDTTLTVLDRKGTLLYMTRADNTLFEQHLFDLGYSIPEELSIVGEKPTAACQLLSDGESLYVLNADNTAAGSIQRLNPQNGNSSIFIKNTAENDELGYYNGVIQGGYLYWTSASDAVHRLSLTESNASFSSGSDHLFANSSNLSGLSVTQSGGISCCSNTWLWGTEKGIYRFTESDINSGQAPVLPAILAEYTIDAIAADVITRKIYFCSGNTLYVCNFDGNHCKALQQTTNALCLSNTDNYIYYSTEDGVCRLPLMQVKENTTVFKPDTLNFVDGITGIAIIEE